MVRCKKELKLVYEAAWARTQADGFKYEPLIRLIVGLRYGRNAQ